MNEPEAFADVDLQAEVAAGHDASHAGPPRSKLFIPAFVVGWAIIWYGATRALSNRVDSNPTALIQHVSHRLGDPLCLLGVGVVHEQDARARHTGLG